MVVASCNDSERADRMSNQLSEWGKLLHRTEVFDCFEFHAQIFVFTNKMAEREGFEHPVFLFILVAYKVAVSRSCLSRLPLRS